MGVVESHGSDEQERTVGGVGCVGVGWMWCGWV